MPLAFLRTICCRDASRRGALSIGTTACRHGRSPRIRPLHFGRVQAERVGPVSLWTDLGFSGNPYDVNPLPANDEGIELLVGRTRETRTLLSQLRNQTLHPTLEGDNGVGKTSLALVAAFSALKARREGAQPQTFIPMTRPLQIGTDPADFDRRALFHIAQTLLQYESELRSYGHNVSRLSELRKWMNDPMIASGGGGVQILGSGFNGDRTVEANTSAGFEQSGFNELVHSALEEAFPTSESGAIVAIVDNLELLSLSNDARRVLERIRDTSLSLPGVKWVLCGARGIVRAAVGSPRLAGRVARPIEIDPIPDAKIKALVDARLSHFAMSPDAKAPVNAEAFMHLYEISNHNLRHSLKYAQDFSIWLEIEDLVNKPAEEFPQLLEVWLADEAERTNSALRLQPRQWQLFDDLAARGGTCAPGDFEEFGFASMQRMRSNFAELERADLVQAEVDEDDHRRKTVSITSKGWIVHYARSGFARR